MRASFALLAVAGLASAQLSAIPSCALTCLSTAIASSGCGLTDTDCQCTTGQAAISKASTPCICKNCTPTEQLAAIEATNNICKADFKSMGKTYTNTAITLNACEIATGTATSPIISGQPTSSAMTTGGGAGGMSSGMSSSMSMSSSMKTGGGAGGMSTPSSSAMMSSMSSGAVSSSAPMSSSASMSASGAAGGAGGMSSSMSTSSPNLAPAATVAAELLFGGVAAAAGYFAL